MVVPSVSVTTVPLILQIIGVVSVLFVSVSVHARVAKSQSVFAVLNCAVVQVIPTIEVWSQVFVQLDVQENVPLCVANEPSQSVVR